MGTAVTPHMEPSETYFVAKTKAMKILIPIMNMRQSKTRIKAAVVRTPLPPLNLKNTGNMCPMITKIPATSFPIKPSIRPAMSTAATHLRTSPARTPRALFVPRSVYSS